MAKPEKTPEEFGNDIDQFLFRMKDGLNEQEIENFRLKLKEKVEVELDTTIRYPRDESEFADDIDDGG